MQILDWLLDADPAIRWQVLHDLADAPADEVARERARVATTGWGARVLELQDPGGTWGGHEYGARGARDGSHWTLQLLRRFGADPAAQPVRAAIEHVSTGVTWRKFDDRPYFAGEVEACVNGGVLAAAAYFGRPRAEIDGLVDRLLGDQLADGGWNCDPPERSTASSVDTTICVVEGLLAVERAVGDVPAVTDARRRAEEYLLERRLFRRRSTGAIIRGRYLDLSFPPYWFHDVLRGLDHFRDAGVADPRLADAVEVLHELRGTDGRWVAGVGRRGRVLIEVEEGVDDPSRWNTLRALRVLRWLEGS
ncbi:hypothetical protein ACFVAJ_04025 [Agromyces sp. NPDC057679]|uniref:hypothetical protein n=1 Tax=Agromyces sp. NPDC057679 TaxID=3346207 RepID=UPI00366B0F1E